MNLLLVEDNYSISEPLKYNLEQNEFNVDITSSVEGALRYLKNNKYSLIIIDYILEDGCGVDLFKIIKDEYNIPSIFLTANDKEEDIVSCLMLGAEDYITKPFKTKELIVRINKILQRNKKENIIKIKDITYNLDKESVYKDNKEISLTSLEIKILNLLFTNINKVVKRDYIVEKIYEWTGNDIYDNTVTVYLKRIREKLDTDIIKTIKGIGYRIDE